MPFDLLDGSLFHASAALKAISAILDKAESHAQSAGTPVEDLLAARLAPDMLDLTFQVHFVTDLATKLVARLQGTDPRDWSASTTAFPANLKTLDQLRARVAEATEVVDAADRDAILARGPDVSVTFNPGPGKTATITAAQYVNGYVVPNIYFHTSTLYGILRSKGVQIGKTDYLMPFIGPFMSA